MSSTQPSQPVTAEHVSAGRVTRAAKRNLGERTSPGKVPRIIWIMWLQGLGSAPHAVRECYNSWVAQNPDWQVVFLDEHNVHDYIDVQNVLTSDNNMQIQARADVIRINLLAEYGGVWADASCFCHKPLDTWIDEYTKSGFFAFDKPNERKLMDNWFMASHENCYLTRKVRDESNAYWLNNTGLTRRQATLLARVLNRLLDRSVGTTKYWFSFPIRRWSKSYPYAWFQYLFSKLVFEDARFREMWEQTPKLSADLPHKLQSLGLTGPLTKEAKGEIDSLVSPVYKLNWRYSPSKYTRDSTLYYLFETVQPHASHSQPRADIKQLS